MGDTGTVATYASVATSKYADKKGYRVQPSPGYAPGSGSPLRDRPKPPPPINPADGPAIVREMIEDSLEDLETHAEWRLHCSGVTFWTFLSSLIGMFMILMSRAMTPLFYSLEKDDVLFGFGIVFQLPLIRWFIIMFVPYGDEKSRRKVIRVKKKERDKSALKGTKFQMMVRIYDQMGVACDCDKQYVTILLYVIIYIMLL